MQSSHVIHIDLLPHFRAIKWMRQEADINFKFKASTVVLLELRVMFEGLCCNIRSSQGDWVIVDDRVQGAFMDPELVSLLAIDSDGPHCVWIWHVDVLLWVVNI